MRLKCQLALDVPPYRSGDPGAYLEVGGHRRFWKAPGQVLAFDDSFLHAAANLHPSADRVILDVSFWHPGLRDGVFVETEHAARHTEL